MNNLKRQQLIKAALSLLETIDYIEKNYFIEFRTEYNFQADKYIDQWYSDYSPKSYKKRLGSLYYAYEVINPAPGVFDVKFGPEFMEGFNHHQSNKIIYHNAFELGYHGGSWGTNNYAPYEGISVLEGDPHWRRKTKNEEGRIGFYDWSYQEVPQSEGLHDILEKLKVEVFNDVDDKMMNKLKYKYKKFCEAFGI